MEQTGSVRPSEQKEKTASYYEYYDEEEEAEEEASQRTNKLATAGRDGKAESNKSSTLIMDEDDLEDLLYDGPPNAQT